MKKQNFLFIALSLALITFSCKPDLPDGLYAKFNTNYGNFTAKLYFKQAPMTVANFVSLAEGTNTLVADKYKGKKFYDSLTFHRVVNGFVIQGGDPLGNGEGGPGYKFPNEIVRGLNHNSKGVLSMANAGPNTNGSQFFITLAPTPMLNGRYSVFGQVVKGQKIVDSIGQVEVDNLDKPLKDVIMEHVKIIRIGKAARNFDGAKVFAKKMEAFKAKKQARKEKINQAIDSLAKGFKKTESGLRYKITKTVEDGAKPLPGQVVEVYYKGMLKNGTVFDKVLEENGQKPIKFKLGVGQVIPGWDEGLQLMQEGEEARFIIPPYLGYGARGAGPIPPHSILVFDVKLVNIVE